MEKEKVAILDYINRLMTMTGCTRLEAFLTLRIEHPRLFDAFGELLRDETRQETTA